MPIKLHISDKDEDLILANIKFIEDGGLRYFRIHNLEDIGINIKYVPISTSIWNKDNFVIYLLENPYLNAENDVFEVYEEKITSERIGWIFPISVLESNDNDYINYKNLNDYKYITYQKLFEFDLKLSTGEYYNDFCMLAEFFKDTIICILCKETINKIPDFNFDDYLLSLYNYGYLIKNSTIMANAIYDKDEFKKKMREERSRIIIKKAKFDISENYFTKLLYKEHLLQSESHIVRFFFLYQIIEYFMEIEFENQFQKYLDKFNNKKLLKNDFRENIINCSRERYLIRDIIASTKIDSDLTTEFINECDFLFKDMGIITKDSFSDKLYDLRNIMTHRLRDLTTKSESLKKITEIFERVITNFLINYEKNEIPLEE